MTTNDDLRAITATAVCLWEVAPPDEHGKADWTEEQFETLYMPFLKALTPPVALRLLDERDALAAENAELREALAGLVGSTDPEHLTGMEMVTQSAPIPEADKAAMLRALRTLRASLTMQVERSTS